MADLQNNSPATPSVSVESEEYVLVPREPNEAMLRDGVMAWTMPWADVIPQDIDEDRYILSAVYRAMIAAAPAPNPSPAAKSGEAARDLIARILVPYSYGAFELQYDTNGERVQPPNQPNAHAKRAADGILAALATPSPQPADAVREALIKPLEWYSPRGSMRYQADTTFGEYWVETDHAGAWCLCDLGEDQATEAYSSLEAAKAAAQADFERRIRATLATPSPQPADAVREALRRQIADQIEQEADLIPCAEDASVFRSAAQLVRAKFSYENADILTESASAGEAVEPEGYLKPETPHAEGSRFVYAKDRNEDWMRSVFTIPVYAHPAPEDTARLREDFERTREREAATAAEADHNADKLAKLEWSVEELKGLGLSWRKRAEAAERERDDARKALETAAEDERDRLLIRAKECGNFEAMGMLASQGAMLPAARSASREATR